MVCPRCIEAVKGILDSTALRYQEVSLGRVSLSEAPDPKQIEQLRGKLEEKGFQLLEEESKMYTNQIKSELLQLIHHSDTELMENTSDYLAQKLNVPYHKLTKAFKTETGQTIEKYLIRQKIERVKELLSYNEFSATQIAYQMGYSSLQHLSNQFKSITGMTLRDYRADEHKDRRSLDAL